MANLSSNVCSGNLNKRSPGKLDIKTAKIFEQSPHITAFHVLQHHAQVRFGLETAQHGHDEGVMHEGKDISLHEGTLHLVSLDDTIFSYPFQSEEFFTFNMLHQKDFTCRILTW